MMAILLSLTLSCSREQDAGMATAVRLHARIESGGETRVDFDEASGKFAWTDGDEIDIHTSAGAYRSVALDASGGFSLELTGSEARDGYAVYPSGIVVTDEADLTLRLPASYDIDGSMDDRYPAALVAVNDPASDDLFFRHAGAIIELILNEVPADTKSFTVTMDKRITGAFPVDGAGTDTPRILTDDAAEGLSVTFTLATALDAQTDAFILHVPVPVGTYEKLKVEMKNASGTVLKTYTHDKSRLCTRARGRKAVFPLEIYSFGPLSGTDFLTINGVPVIWFNDHNEQETTVQITSFKSYDGGLSQIAVPVEVMGYATADADGNCNEDWTTEQPSTLLEFNFSDNSPEQQNLVVKVSEQTEKTVRNELIEHAGTLQSRPLADNIDLAFQDIGNGLHPRSSGKPRTANCYVVDRAGTYRFPVVYGNAVDWVKQPANGCHTKSYLVNTSQTNTTSYYYNFQRFDDNLITSPYILQDVGLTVEDVEAVVLWEDVPSSDYTMLSVNPVVTETSVSGYCDLDGTALTTVPYIHFNVLPGSIDPNEDLEPTERVRGIRQGNIVIALRTKESAAPVTVAGNPIDPGTILWSWHIWITDQDLTPKNTVLQTGTNVPAVNAMMPYNLGWCDTGLFTQWHDRAWYVKIRQTEGTIAPIVVKVIQKGDKTRTGSSSPFYQFGRKDPFLPSTGSGAINKPAYSPIGRVLTSSDSAVSWSDSPSDGPASSIRNPEVMYFTTISGLPYPFSTQNTWMAGSRPANLWNIDLNLDNNLNKVVSSKLRKSIFDPTPVGFMVPHLMSFSFAIEKHGTDIYASQGHNYEITYLLAPDRNGDNVLNRKDFEAGWWLYTGNGNETIFLPACGARAWSNGALEYVNTQGAYLMSPASDINSNHKCSFGSSYFASWNGLLHPVSSNRRLNHCCSIRPVMEQ